MCSKFCFIPLKLLLNDFTIRCVKFFLCCDLDSKVVVAIIDKYALINLKYAKNKVKYTKYFIKNTKKKSSLKIKNLIVSIILHYVHIVFFLKFLYENG